MNTTTTTFVLFYHKAVERSFSRNENEAQFRFRKCSTISIGLTDAIHRKILEEKGGAIEAPWLGRLPFKMDLYGDGQYQEHSNVLEMMQTTALTGRYLCFSPETYPPTEEAESLKECLVRNICLVSHENSVELVYAGGMKCPICKSLICSCG